MQISAPPPLTLDKLLLMRLFRTRADGKLSSQLFSDQRIEILIIWMVQRVLLLLTVVHFTTGPPRRETLECRRHAGGNGR